ncbi:hypothetical protein Bca4012_014059 [Brassica carinata]
MMQATISSSQPPQFQERFAAGTMFFMSGFDVSRCAHNVRLTDSSLLIRFNETTSFDEITEPVSPLPEKHFDVIGEILGVKSTVCDPPEEKNRDMVTMKLDRLVTRDTGLPSAAPLLRSYAKVETMTIAELNSFIVLAASQEIDFLCTGKVVRVDIGKGWCYVACSKCSKNLQGTVTAFTCGRCNNSHAVGALW